MFILWVQLFENLRTCFFFKSPLRRQIKFATLLQPLSNDVWTMISIFYLMFIVSLSVLLISEIPTTGKLMYVNNAFFMCLTAICQQGNVLKKNSINVPRQIITEYKTFVTFNTVRIKKGFFITVCQITCRKLFKNVQSKLLQKLKNFSRNCWTRLSS